MTTSPGDNYCRVTGTMGKENTEDLKARIASLVEWTKQEVEGRNHLPHKNAPAADKQEECHSTDADAKKKITHFPSMDDTGGIEEKFVRLCATMAGGVYKTTQKKEFETMLKTNSEICKAFPDLTLRFYQTGVTLGRLHNSNNRASLNAPTLAGVITGDTLLLVYRGTVTIADMLADLKMDSVQDSSHVGLEVQGAYYNLVVDSYFGKKSSHKRDMINYLTGNYSKVPNKTTKDGIPIQRILISGHSLGGGLAQVTHLCFKSRGSGVFHDLVDTIDARHVQVKTVAFAAPMTTLVTDHASPDTLEFLKETIQPHMRNFVYKMDPVPRGYAHLSFILDLLEHIKAEFIAAKAKDDIEKLQVLTDELKQSLQNPWVLEYLAGKIDMVLEQAQQYRHVGKVIYYDHESAVPAVYVDNGDAATTTFRSLGYQKSAVDDPLADALKYHSFLVTDNGLAYA